MKNTFLPAELLRYEDEYAVIKLLQFSGDDVDLENEEVMNITMNGESQNLPNVGSTIMIFYDHFGEMYVMGEIVSAHQASVDVTKPKMRKLANDKGWVQIDEDGKITADNGSGSVVVEPGGNIILNGGTEPAVKGDAFKGTYDVHGHSTAFGPSGPPLVLLPPTNFNLTVKL